VTKKQKQRILAEADYFKLDASRMFAYIEDGEVVFTRYTPSRYSCGEYAVVKWGEIVAVKKVKNPLSAGERLKIAEKAPKAPVREAYKTYRPISILDGKEGVIRTLLKDGVSRAEIARMYGLSYTGVKEYVIKHGLGEGLGASKAKLTGESETIREALKAGVTKAQLARSHSVGYDTMRYYIKTRELDK